MLKVINDQATGLRNLMCFSQAIDDSNSTSLSDLLTQLDGLGFASFHKKLALLKIPLIELMDHNSAGVPLDILNSKKIVLYINESTESIKAAYGIVKLLNKSLEGHEIGFLIESSHQTKSKTIFHNIKMAANKFGLIQLTHLGSLLSGHTYISAHNSAV